MPDLLMESNTRQFNNGCCVSLTLFRNECPTVHQPEIGSANHLLFTMQICDLLLLVSFAILSLVNCQAENEEGNERAERLAEMMKHDGVERVVELSQKNVKRLLKKYNIVIVMYHTATNDTVLRQEKHALEVT